MTTYLLDVNVLLALADPLHVDHVRARNWFHSQGRQSWATCPITENGFLRIASQPNYPNRQGDVAAVLAILQTLRSQPGHGFWPDDLSVVDVVRPGVVITPAQITDTFLLGLAVRRGEKLATLDRRVPVDAVSGGRAALEVIPI